MSASLYKSLTTDSSCDREKAASALIEHLTTSKKDSAWDEAYDKIVIGLASPNPETRLGFAMALSFLLMTRGPENINVQDLMKKLPTVSQSKKEFQNSADAALLSVNVIFDSNVLSWPNFDSNDFETLVDYLLTILPENQQSDQNTAFTQTVFLHIFMMIQLLEDSNVAFEHALKYILTQVDKRNLTLSPCAISLYLMLSPEQGLKFGCFPNGWIAGNPLAKDNFSSLKKVLQTTMPEHRTQKSTSKSDKNKSLQENIKFPFVWQKIIHTYSKSWNLDETKSTSFKKLKSDKKGKKSKTLEKDDPVQLLEFKEFWKNVVDDTLFSQSSSFEQKLNGVNILTLSISNLKDAPKSILKFVFSQNLIDTLASSKQNKNSSKANNQFLNAIKNLSSAILKTTKTSSLLPAIALETIYSSKYSHNFDKITKTKTVQELFNNLNADSIRELASFLSKVILNPFEHDHALSKNSDLVESRRKWALDRIVSLVKSPLLNSDTNSEWFENLLNLLISHGFFKSVSGNAEKLSKKDASKEAKKRKHKDTLNSFEDSCLEPSPKFSDTFISLLQERTATIVAISVAFKRDDGASWPYHALSQFKKLEAFGSKYKCLLEFSDEISNQENKTLSVIEKIRSRRQDSSCVDSPQLSVFEMLFSLVLFQLYSGDTESAGVLEELQSCYNSIQCRKENEEQDEDDDLAVDPTVVLTEILLSFISRESASFRKVSETVWKTFSSQITKASLQRLYDVLATPESAEGQNDLFDNFDTQDLEEESDLDDSDTHEHSESDESNDSEEEENEDKEIEFEEDQEEESSKDSDKENSAREDIEEIEKESRRKLALALGLKNGQDSTMEESDQDDDDSDDDTENLPMTEEEMKRLDEQLGAIFSERRNALLEHSGKTKEKRKEAKIARHNITMFKNRVVDLLEIYFKEQATESPLFLTMINPLLHVIKTTNSKDLGEKITAFLKKDVCKAKTTDKMIKMIIRDEAEANYGKESKDEDHDDEEMDDSQSDEEIVNDEMNHPEFETLSSSSVSVSDILAWIKEIHHLAQSPKINVLGQCCNQASVFLSKVLLQIDDSNLDYILAAYTETFKHWVLHRQSKVTIAMFNDFLNWASTYRQKKIGAGHLHDEEKSGSN